MNLKGLRSDVRTTQFGKFGKTSGKPFDEIIFTLCSKGRRIDFMKVVPYTAFQNDLKYTENTQKQVATNEKITGVETLTKEMLSEKGRTKETKGPAIES